MNFVLSDPDNQKLEEAYDKLREQAEQTLRHSAYSVVNLSSLFQPLLWENKSEVCSKEELRNLCKLGSMNLLSQLCTNVLFIDTYKSQYMFRLLLKPSSRASRLEY
jgi:hypothetical protein